MATGTTWQRRIMATGVAAAAVLTPLWSATPAVAASLCAPPADTVPPQISSLTFSRDTVDLNSGSRKVTFTAHATDTSGDGSASGVRRIVIYSGERNDREFATTRLTLASGTTDDGMWTGTLTIPKVGRPGTWTIEDVEAADSAGNSEFYSNGGRYAQSPTDLRVQAGWDTSITVTGTVAPPPKGTAGTLTGLAFSRTTIDTTQAARTVHVTATFSAPHPKLVRLFFFKTSGRGRQYEVDAALTHSTGSRWAGHFRVPRWVGNGKVRPQLTAVFGNKVTPHVRQFGSAKLRALHLPAVLQIVSGVDKTKPMLKTLAFSPASVDTTSGLQTVTVTATATDTHSGVSQVNANLFINNGSGGSVAGFYPYPGLGFDQSGGVNVSLKPSGDKWIGTLKFRECVPGGKWHASVFVADRAENASYYSSKKLIAAGLPGTLSVTSTPGDVDPPAVRDATASGSDHTITLDFTEGVKNVNTSTLSVFAAKPASTRYQSVATMSLKSCSNGTTTVDCSGIGAGGLVTSAILNVPALVGGAEYFVYANLGAVTTQLTDGAGNPLPWYFGAADVTGS
jgi:hypothetical protein